MPLVQPGREPLDEPLSEAHGRARKIEPRYTEGRLVRVAGGRNQAEAELIQGLLLEEGIPSMLRRTAGFDVPDFLAAGPRDVLVPEAGSEAARELLHQAELGPSQAAATRPSPVKLVGAIVLGGAGAALIAWLLQGPA
jgi:Putative prokaryotic signal transducing protein